ncbi:hypothetical protein PO909_003637 [Leuciscus waleckii]
MCDLAIGRKEKERKKQKNKQKCNNPYDPFFIDVADLLCEDQAPESPTTGRIQPAVRLRVRSGRAQRLPGHVQLSCHVNTCTDTSTRTCVNTYSRLHLVSHSHFTINISFYIVFLQVQTGDVDEPKRRCFTEFLSAFPVSLQGQPPSKVQRTSCGFPGDRTYYDKWRLSQYDLRRAHLLGYFGTHRPSAGKVARLISAEGWSGNCPRLHEIVEAWKPPSRSRVETNPLIIRHVTEQSWTGIAIKDFGPPKGVIATQHYSKGNVVCDYHGRIITAAEGKAILSRLRDEAGYQFFFDSPSGKMCMDAQTFPCACHPGKDTYGRRINHSGKSSELKLGDNVSDVILFRATRDIPVDTEFFWDYGVNRKSFRGEGLELEWLDD